MRLIYVLAALAATPAWAVGEPKTPLQDPYKTGMWDFQQMEILGDPEAIAFDDRVTVFAPLTAEDSMHVPVTVDATAIPDVEEIVVTVDYGPIPHILTYKPVKADAKISFRFKIDQRTPVRASVRTRDGAWHVGGAEIDAAGGGCTAPAAAYAQSDWYDKLGQVHARAWPSSGRVRLVVDHPMDTGLADGIPMFIIEDLTVRSEAGEELARIELKEPVNEDPTFTLHFARADLAGALHIDGRDNNGNEIEAVIPGPAIR